MVSSPLRVTLGLQGAEAILSWSGGVPPFEVQEATDLAKGDWERMLTNAVPPLSLSMEGKTGFYRVIGY
jgi:hypothetical protein